MTPQLPCFDLDDEDFDWDAAVSEIDAATATATAKSSYLFVTPPQQPPIVGPISGGDFNFKVKQPPVNNRRQLTLDSFITNRASTSKVEKQDEQIRVSESRCFVEIDPEAAKTWVYPENVPPRDYQLAISETALFSNTLVVLPTGLGKTLIAAVVMYNYFRWFPEGKIVFAAPSRPLVMQQIEACHNIVGIPQEWTIDMTGQTSPPKRASLWQSKRVFFVTPQVLEKDIQSGACLVKHLVCLVIDEAHRAMGNYAYCVAVRELMAVPVQLRILALTATPGSKQQTIQQVIDHLQISTLEYRSESDVDVCPYVHNRKTELFEVPMGKDATDIHNLLLEAIRPIANRLSTMGLLQNRDFQTFSPCDLLNSRENFRQAPPPELPPTKCDELYGYFTVLITLYHIRKLLSGHGIRPAHEMLKEKLKQGYFARFMTRNEFIQEANVLMEKNLSHGAASPKLSKLMDVLVDHFRNNDPKNSRVIIFSNFRSSVKDILDSLAKIKDLVKATGFIGQSSGKTLKGQSQKTQQEVLEKFRAGELNCIVATSIGEEGLDIMEVDLVICFDANISPLRMIQRMGRTGRKNDGRVVVLACEGTEMKGYKRKLATGKTVIKHMQNGGLNSFNFHCSPRMVPHLYKPERQFLELSIEKFVRQTKKLRNDSPQTSKYREKLTDDESALLKKYFPSFEEPCKLSLIAFPHFQAFPSGVHKVKHSARSGWLMDAMQDVQGLSFTTSQQIPFDFSRSHCLTSGGMEQHNESPNELLNPDNQTGSQMNVVTSETCVPGTELDEEQHTLDSIKIVSKFVTHVPDIPPLRKQNMRDTSLQIKGKGHVVERIQLSNDGELTEKAPDDAVIICTPPYDEKFLKKNVFPESVDAMESESPSIPADKFDVDISDLSPRLTSFVESGFVPESPLAECNDFNETGANDADSTIDAVKEDICVVHQSQPRCVNSLTYNVATQKRESIPTNVVDDVHTCLNEEAVSPNMGGNSESPLMENLRTPLQNLTNSSCSEDWRLSSGEKSRTSKTYKLKRLRKIGEFVKPRQQTNVGRKLTRSYADPVSKDAPQMIVKNGRVKKVFEDARDFIDEEAEVCTEDIVPDSDDEDEANCNNSDAYEDSFIDDQVQPTFEDSQVEESKVDMMAIYRRSLLTQSPFRENDVASPKSVPSLTTIVESGECSGKSSDQTPQHSLKPNFSGRNSLSSRLRRVIPINNSSCVDKATTDSRKRKLNPNKPFCLPVKNLEKDFSSHSEFSSKENNPPYLANETDASWVGFSDDQFYENIDLDELEAQAAKLISQRSRSTMENRKISEPSAENTSFISPTSFDPPSFDLGI